MNSTNVLLLLKWVFVLMVGFVATASCSRHQHGSPPEWTVLHNIALGIELYSQDNGGRAASDWKQLDKYIKLDELNSQYLIQSSAYPIQEHYRFFTNRVPAPQPGKGDAVLLRSTPLTNGDGVVGRYVIFWNPPEAKPSWMPESEVKQMLSKTNVKLP